MRWRYVYDRGHDKMIEVTEDYRAPLVDKPAHHIFRDIKPYQSMITGEMINSRSRHREHLREHRCIEVGNDSSLFAQPKPVAPPPGLKETLIRVANEKLRYK